MKLETDMIITRHHNGFEHVGHVDAAAAACRFLSEEWERGVWFAFRFRWVSVSGVACRKLTRRHGIFVIFLAELINFTVTTYQNGT